MTELKDSQLIAKFGEKISNMCKAIGGLDKDGENKHSNYDYISSDNLLGELRSKLAPNKLAIIPQLEDIQDVSRTAEKQGGGKTYWTKTTVKMSFEVIDTETGYVKMLHWTGSDQDTSGKSLGQAITECTKRFYFKLFQVSSKEDSDPDSNSGSMPTDDEQDQESESDTLANSLKPKGTPASTETKKDPKPEKVVADQNEESAGDETPEKETWLKKLTAFLIDPEYQSAINTILKEKKVTKESIKNANEESASVICDLIMKQKDYEVKASDSTNWADKLTELKNDKAYLKIINDLVVAGDIKGKDLNTMHNATAKGLCDLIERTKGFESDALKENLDTQPVDDEETYF